MFGLVASPFFLFIEKSFHVCADMDSYIQSLDSMCVHLRQYVRVFATVCTCICDSMCVHLRQYVRAFATVCACICDSMCVHLRQYVRAFARLYVSA